MRGNYTSSLVRATVAAGLLAVLTGCGSDSAGGSTSTVICEFSEIDSYWDVLARSDLVVRARLEAQITDGSPDEGMRWIVEATVLQGPPSADVTEIVFSGRQFCNQFAAYGPEEFAPGRDGILFLVDSWRGDSRGPGEPEVRYAIVEHPWAAFYYLDELEAKITEAPFPVGRASTRRLNEEVGAVPLARFTPPGFFEQ